MYLFHILLKIIKDFTLTDSENYSQLKKDVKEWEEDAMAVSDDDKDKIKVFYKRIHKGVFMRLLNPILYFFVLKNLTGIMNPGEEAEEGLY